MRIILTLLRKDFANFIRDKAAVSLTFLVPIALIYIFGQVFGLNRKDTGPTGIRLAVVNQSDNPAGRGSPAPSMRTTPFNTCGACTVSDTPSTS